LIFDDDFDKFMCVRCGLVWKTCELRFNQAFLVTFAAHNSWLRMDPLLIDISAFDYDLPLDRIAAYPVHPKDHSRLLIYREGQIHHRPFYELTEELRSGVQLCVNDSRVIPARLLFEKATGGRIEVFCLEPDPMYPEPSMALNSRGRVYWRCLIGGASKWKKGTPLQLLLPDSEKEEYLTAHLLEKGETDFQILFEWPEAIGSFGEVLERAGRIPLPPYIKRAPQEADQTDYQTTYAQQNGSVAAPTAGLHFTDSVLKALKQINIEPLPVTLHVGAGTFKPVTANRLENHAMHGEWIHIQRSLLSKLLQHQGKRVVVGTTTLRTLESIYWLGNRLCQNQHASLDLLTQWEPYETPDPVSVPAAIEALMKKMDNNGIDSLWSRTELLIAPGYQIRMADGIITNFHQPRSTLLLLISAFIGEDWRRVYSYAMENDFRFLSYGDSSLLWRS
jgi:S-adenosylmethionine:tRNA ribosyltransferase-isomerase